MINSLMPPGRVRVLRELLLHPERELYLRELAVRAGVSLSSAQREVRRLTEAGILARVKPGRQPFYRANTRSPLYPELHAMLLKTVGLGEALREALAQRGIQLALIYGSLAVGQERADSDVDLLVVGTVRPRALSDLLARAERALGREINSMVLTPREFAERVKRKDHFLSSVLAGPKLFVIGDEDEAARLAA